MPIHSPSDEGGANENPPNTLPPKRARDPKEADTTEERVAKKAAVAAGEGAEVVVTGVVTGAVAGAVAGADDVMFDAEGDVIMADAEGVVTDADGTEKRSEAAEGGQLAVTGDGNSRAEAPQVFYEVHGVGNHPGGGSADNKELSLTPDPPPKGSVWFRLPGQKGLVAFPEDALMMLRNHGMDDGVQGYEMITSLLQVVSVTTMSAQQRQLADHAKQVLDKLKADHEETMTKQKKKAEQEMRQIKAEFDEELEKLEDNQEALIAEAAQFFANEVAAKKLTPAEQAAAFHAKGDAMTGNAKAKCKLWVEMKKLVRVNRIVHKLNQQNLAKDLQNCGDDLKKKMSVFEKLFDQVESEETDTSFSEEEHLVFWKASCEAFMVFAKLMPSSDVPQKEMTEAALSKWKLDLQTAQRKAALHLIDIIYMLLPCPGCHADLRRASNRGGPESKPDYWKAEMNKHKRTIPCVFQVFPSNICVPCVGNQPLRRYPEDVGACFRAVGAFRGCKPPLQVDSDVFRLPREELADDLPPRLKKLVLDEEVDNLFEELNDGKPPIGCDPWTDAHIANICLGLRQYMGTDRRLGVHLGALNRSLCRIHELNPDVAIAELLTELFEIASAPSSSDSKDPNDPDDSKTGSETEESSDDDDEEVDSDEQPLKEKPVEEDAVVAAVKDEAVADDSESKKPRKSKKKFYPITSPQQLLDCIFDFCAGDKTALLSVLQPASPDDDNLSPKQIEDQLRTSMMNTKWNRSMLETVSEEYWALQRDPELSPAEKQEEVNRRTDQIVCDGFAKYNATAGVEFWDNEVKDDKAARATCLRGLKTVLGRVRANVLPEDVFKAWLEGRKIDDPKFEQIFGNSVYFKEWRKRNIANKGVTREVFGLSAVIRMAEDAIVAMYKRVEVSMEHVNKVNKKTQGYVKKSHMRRADVKAVIDAVAMLDPNQILEKYGGEDSDEFKNALELAKFGVPENIRGANPTSLSLLGKYDQCLALKAFRKNLTYVKPKVTRSAGAGGKRKTKSGAGPSKTQTCLAEQHGILSCFVIRKKEQKSINDTKTWRDLFIQKMKECPYTKDDVVAVYRALGKPYQGVTIEQIMQGWFSEDNECVIDNGYVPMKLAKKIAKAANVSGNLDYEKELKVDNRLNVPQNAFTHAIYWAWTAVSDEMAAVNVKQKRQNSRVREVQQHQQAVNHAHTTQGHMAVVAAKNEELASSKKAAVDAQTAQKAAEDSVASAEDAKKAAEDEAATSKKAAEDAQAAQKAAEDSVAGAEDAKKAAEDEAATLKKAAEDALAGQKAAEHNAAAMKWATDHNSWRCHLLSNLMTSYMQGHLTQQEYEEQYYNLPLEVSPSQYVAPPSPPSAENDTVLFGGVVPMS